MSLGRAYAKLPDEVVEGLVIDFIETPRGEIRPALLGSLAQDGTLGRLFGLLALQEPKTFAQHLTGVLVAPRLHQRLNEFVLVLTQDNVSRRHGDHLRWQYMP